MEKQFLLFRAKFRDLTPRQWRLVAVVTIVTVAVMLLVRSRQTVGPIGLPPHFSGLGMFSYQEIALGLKPRAFARRAAQLGLTFVIVKANDGRTWGTKVHGRWTPQFDQSVPAAFHRAGLRCYGYGTTRLKPLQIDQRAVDPVPMQVQYAIKVLHLGADGYVFDDVFLTSQGYRRDYAERLFGEVRQHVDTCRGCRGKVVAFSTFPHLWRRRGLPWDVAIQHCHYFLPQSYWRTHRKTPEGELHYTQQQWDRYGAERLDQSVELISHQRGASRIACTVIPTAHTFVARTPAEGAELERFLKTAYPHYRGVAIFRWGITDPETWPVVKRWGWKWRERR